MLKCIDKELIIEGKSKRIYSYKEDVVLVELKPTLGSFTFNKKAEIPGTEILRLDFYEAVSECFKKHGILSTFIFRQTESTFLAKYIENVPPFETIIKNYAVGSTLRKYPGLFEPNEKLAHPIVKFDYRIDPEDQPIADDYVALYGVDVMRVKEVALKLNKLLSDLLSPYLLLDICFIFGTDENGQLFLTSEVSPDGFRVRDIDGDPYDKDIFRLGLPDKLLFERWKTLIDHVKNKV